MTPAFYVTLNVCKGQAGVGRNVRVLCADTAVKIPLHPLPHVGSWETDDMLARTVSEARVSGPPTGSPRPPYECGLQCADYLGHSESVLHILS